MFGHGGFDGEFRRKPNVNIAGKSKEKQSRADVILQASRKRHQREASRIEAQSARLIQRCVRSYLARRNISKMFRAQFDSLRLDYNADEKAKFENLHGLTSRLNIFYSFEEDVERLTWLSGALLKESPRVVHAIQTSQSAYLIKRFLGHLSRQLWRSSTSENINPSVRLLETISSNSSSTKFTQLLPIKIYFLALKNLLVSRCPPDIENMPVPPLIEVLLRLIRIPLSIDCFDANICKEFNSAFLNSDEILQRKLIIPYLRKNNFPLLEWCSFVIMDLRSQANLEVSCHLLHSFLQLSQGIASKNIGNEDLANWSHVLAFFCDNLHSVPVLQQKLAFEAPIEEDESNQEMDTSTDTTLRETLTMLSELSWLSDTNLNISLTSLSSVCHLLLRTEKEPLNCPLVRNLACCKKFLHLSWKNIVSLQSFKIGVSKGTNLLQILIKGFRIGCDDQFRLARPLTVFCELFRYLLMTVNDKEFYEDSDGNGMPFKLSELRGIIALLRDAAIGLVELAFPETRTNPLLSAKVRIVNDAHSTEALTLLLKSLLGLLKELHLRDTRKQFCPDNHWIACNKIILSLDKTDDNFQDSSLSERYLPFQCNQTMSKDEMEVCGPPISTKHIRTSMILRNMPFTIPFNERLELFHRQILKEKQSNQGERVHFLDGPAINISIRRSYLYEDSFEKLSPKNEPNLKLKMRVQLKNYANLEEAGIDGGGIFREFITELLLTCFDPNRGFFKLTQDQHLYPNPSAALIHQDCHHHYHFIGRMLGKAILERHLVDIPLAGFFLTKVFWPARELGIDHLASLDPDLYKNLLYLKYSDEVDSLNLNFTVVTSEIGRTRIEELKPNGKNIPVTKENRIEYLHLMAAFKLNRQIRGQCKAFREGIMDVISLDWLQMFNYREIQTIVSGSENFIDVDDLKRHTVYGNGFSVDSATIIIFWKVVNEFDEESKRALLKFVTSCPRAPLLGFKELDPPFCIQSSGKDSRLPTASTCMNLLKMPEFTDEEILREKLHYSIYSGAGFELS